MGLLLELDTDEPVDDELWDEHLAAWQAWGAVSTQWRTVVVTGATSVKIVWLGLDYTAARAGLALAGIDPTPDVWAQVRLIEEGAIEEMNRGR